MAERLGLGADVCDPLQQMFTRWDGKGVPGGVGGEDDRRADAAVPPGRHRRGLPPQRRRRRRGRGGPRPARHTVRPDGRRRCSAPVAASARRHRRRADWHTLIEADPACSGAHRAPSSTPRWRRSPTSPTCGRRRGPGHSRGVAELAARGRRLCGSPSATSTMVRRAGAGPRHRHARRARDDPRQARPADRRRSRSGCGCTPTTPNGCWPAHRPLARDRRDRVARHERLRRLRLPPWPRRRRDPRPGRLLAAAVRLPRHDRAAPVPAGADSDQAGRRRAAGRGPRRPARRRRGRRRARPPAGPATASGAPARPGSPHARSRCSTLIARGASTRQVAAATGDHPEDGRDPHRADLHQDRRLDPLDRDAVRMQHGLLDSLDTARSVGGTPDDAGRTIRTVIVDSQRPDARRRTSHARQGSHQLDHRTRGPGEGHRRVPGRRRRGRVGAADPDVPHQRGRPARGRRHRRRRRVRRAARRSPTSSSATRRPAGRYYVCPICFNAKKLDQARSSSGAELQGTVPMWNWIGDEGATTFSY